VCGSQPADPARVRAQLDTRGLRLDMPSPLDELARLDVDLLAIIVEQDPYPCDYPCDQNIPPPIDNRTARHLAGCGLGPVPTGTD
jgi:hypothetical protein